MEIPGDSCACGDYDQNWLREDNMPVRSTNGCDQQRVRQRTRHGALKVVKHATVLYKVRLPGLPQYQYRSKRPLS